MTGQQTNINFFHDRTGLIPEREMKVYNSDNRKQDLQIFSIFCREPERSFTPIAVTKILNERGINILLGSVRRGINHLAWMRDKNGRPLKDWKGDKIPNQLICTGHVMEVYGKKNYCYRLKK